MTVLLEFRAFLVWKHVLEQSNERKTRGTGNVCPLRICQEVRLFHFQEVAELASEVTLVHVGNAQQRLSWLVPKAAPSLLPPVVQPAAPGDCEAIGSCAMVSFGLNSPHCQKVKTQNLVLQEHLESIGAPLNTKASRTHHGQKQTESGKPSLNRRAAHFISLSAHKPRLNQFCPEIPLMGACVCNP